MGEKETLEEKVMAWFVVSPYNFIITLFFAVILSLSLGSLLISGSEVASTVGAGQSSFIHWQGSHYGAETGKKNIDKQ